MYYVSLTLDHFRFGRPKAAALSKPKVSECLNKWGTHDTVTGTDRPDRPDLGHPADHDPDLGKSDYCVPESFRDLANSRLITDVQLIGH